MSAASLEAEEMSAERRAELAATQAEAEYSSDEALAGDDAGAMHTAIEPSTQETDDVSAASLEGEEINA